MANRTRRLDIEIASEKKGSGFKDTASDADKMASGIQGASAKAKGAFSGLDAEAKGLGSKLAAARREAAQAFAGIEGDARGLGNRLGAAGKAAGGQFGESISDGAKEKLDGFQDELKEALGMAGGVAAGAGFVAGFTEVLDRGAEGDIVAASLGLTPEQSRIAGDVAGSLYADAYGASMADVSAAVEQVGSTLTTVTQGNAADLERLTAKAMDVATVFRMDVADSTRLAGVAIQHGLARDADHAFDLITAAMQRMPAHMREELLPTIEEYGSFLHNMGFTGEQAFGLLAEASKGGTFEIDKTADALKELSIRATDMSASSVAAYEAAGLSAEDMSERFLAGGDTARGALDDLISGLLNIEDPVARANAAIGLFGTPIEDLSVNEIPQFLESLQSANTSLGDVSGAAEEAGAIVNDNLKTKLTALQRQGLAPVISTIDVLTTGFLALPGPVQALIGGLGGISAAAVPAVWAGRKLLDAWRSASEFAGNMRSKVADLSSSLDLGGRAGGRMSGALGKLKSAAAMAGPALAAVGIAAAGLEIFNQLRIDRVADEIDGLADVDTSRLSSVRDGLRTYREELEQLEQREGKGRLFSVMGANVFATGGDADRQERIDQLRDRIGELEETEGSLEQQERQLASAYVGSDRALGGLNEETSNAVNHLQEMSDALQAQFDPLFGMLDALNGNADANDRLAEANQALNEARAGGDPEAIAAAERDLAAAHREVTSSAVDVTAASNQLTAGIQAGTVSLEDARGQLMTWVSQGLISGETARAMAQDFDVAAFSAGALGSTDPNVRVTETGAQPTGASMDGVARRARAIPKSTHTSLTASDHATSKIEGVRRMIAGLPRTHTIDVAWRTGVIPQILFGGGRAAGGPVAAGRLYEVAEQGKAELLEMGGRSYLIPGQDGNVVPADAGAGGGSGLAGILVGVGNQVSGAVVNSATAQMRGSKLYHDHLVRYLSSNVEPYLDWIRNGVETLIKQNAWGARNVRWFEDLASVHRARPMADGAIVRRRPGGILANIGEGQHDEGVFPLTDDFLGGGGDTYVVNVDARGSVGLDPADLERVVVRALNHAERKGARVKVRR